MEENNEHNHRVHFTGDILLSYFGMDSFRSNACNNRIIIDWCFLPQLVRKANKKINANFLIFL